VTWQEFIERQLPLGDTPTRRARVARQSNSGGFVAPCSAYGASDTFTHGCGSGSTCPARSSSAGRRSQDSVFARALTVVATRRAPGPRPAIRQADRCCRGPDRLARLARAL